MRQADRGQAEEAIWKVRHCIEVIKSVLAAAAAAPGAVVVWQGHPQVRGPPTLPTHTQDTTGTPSSPC